jgi:hypothetical protein
VRIAQGVTVLRDQNIVERSRNVLLEELGAVIHNAGPYSGVVEVDDDLNDHEPSTQQLGIGQTAGSRERSRPGRLGNSCGTP